MSGKGPPDNGENDSNIIFVDFSRNNPNKNNNINDNIPSEDLVDVEVTEEEIVDFVADIDKALQGILMLQHRFIKIEEMSIERIVRLDVTLQKLNNLITELERKL